MSSNQKHKSLFQQFGDFLKTFGVIGLAIAFVIGNASSTLVQAFVGDLINPFIGLWLPSGSLQSMNYNMTGISGVTSTFKYGDTISQVINFIIIAFIVFMFYRELSKLKLVEDKTQQSPK